MLKNILQNLYKDKSNKSCVKRTYAFGLFYYKENKESYKTEFRFCGLPILKRKISNGKIKYYLLFLNILQKSSRKYLYNKILQKVGSCYKNIYVNYNCSGETYLYLAYLKPAQNSVFIATRKYHIDLCKMMHPDIDCIYMPEILALRSFDDIYEEEYKNKTFYNILPFKHFVRLENKIHIGEKLHYCKEICKTIGIKPNSKIVSPQVNDKIKAIVLEKTKRISLNLEKFVLLCPESQSNEDLDKEFWINLTKELYGNGYDIFTNALFLKAEYGISKTCFLTLNELYYLASLSKGIICLRSGVIEPLTAIKSVPITCLYTDFKDRGCLKSIKAETVLECFSLKELPNAEKDNIDEIVIQKGNSIQVLNKIIGGYNK